LSVDTWRVENPPYETLSYPLENELNLTYTKLIETTTQYLEALNRWENDPVLIPFMRVCQSEEDLRKRTSITPEELEQRLEHDHTWLIHLDGQLIGEMGYQVDPKHLYKKMPGTAWIGITIGEESGRGRGIGYLALQYLEGQIKEQGLQRIELGVFEFNKQAFRLYQKLGYREFARIDDFTYWKGRKWQDIRMEKYIQHAGESDE
jgi:RimJ/RimL family protein N-acetyltransferase